MTVREGYVVLSICYVTKIVFSRQREQKQDSKWISDQFLILRLMSHIQFPHSRFTFQQKAAPCNPRVCLANVIGECNGVICGGRDVLTGPKLLSNIPHINHFLQGWKRSWALWKIYLSFSEAFQFLGCSWTCSQRRGDILGKQRDALSYSPAGDSGTWLPDLEAALKAQRWKNPGLIGFYGKNLVQQNYLSASMHFIFSAKHPFSSVY